LPLSSLADLKAAVAILVCNTLFQFRDNHKFPGIQIVCDAEKIGFAAHLAVFYIALTATSGLIHYRQVALAAACALKPGVHINILKDDAGDAVDVSCGVAEETRYSAHFNRG